MVEYKDGNVTNLDSILISAENYSGVLTNLSIRELNEIQVEGILTADEFLISQLIEEFPAIQLTGQGEIEYAYNNGQHDLQGYFSADSINYKNVTTGNSVFDIKYSDAEDTAAFADVSGVVQDLVFGKKHFDEVLVMITANEGIITVDRIEGHNQDGEFLYFAGSISDSLRVYDIDELYGNINQLDFSVGEFNLARSGSAFLLDTTIVNVGTGNISLAGNYNSRSDYHLAGSLKNLELKFINDFF